MGEQNPYKTGSITLSKAEYEAVRKYLDALKPDVYAKCGRCERWIMEGPINLSFNGSETFPICERCNR